ncbi:MAG TPA: glycerate kinase [Bacteroidales bacterium]|jgi:glycerate 2-kinase|nr:glycerate kinase [Bacteroidales bacterium]
MDNVLRNNAKEIFLAGVEIVKPDILIPHFVSLENNVLKIENHRFQLAEIKNIYLTGAGKASALMAKAIENILGSRISSGHIVTKYGHAVPLKYAFVTEAGHPVPDENGVKGTENILSIVNKASKDDLVICVISGGGSALLTDIPDGCTLNDLKILTDLLLKSGANINEMNCIRKHLSKVKGGMLSSAAYPARVVSLILSDVIGDPLDVIASGPTAPDPTTFKDAMDIIEKYGIKDKIPAGITKILNEGLNKIRKETLKESDEAFRLTTNLIIGNNKLALKKASKKAEALGYTTKIITDSLHSDVEDVADYIFSKLIKYRNEKPGKKSCLLFGGEPTIKITGDGLGGRNQHLALLMAQKINGINGVVFLSGGTDGTDGPTDAAGAIAEPETLKRSEALGLDINKYISDCDSYNFFRQEGGLIKTGPTQTNVMDLIVVLIN